MNALVKSIMYPQQDQYMFIHDALSDYITCGDTSVIAHELRIVIDEMEKEGEKRKSGFENQFGVHYNTHIAQCTVPRSRCIMPLYPSCPNFSLHFLLELL